MFVLTYTVDLKYDFWIRLRMSPLGCNNNRRHVMVWLLLYFQRSASYRRTSGFLIDCGSNVAVVQLSQECRSRSNLGSRLSVHLPGIVGRLVFLLFPGQESLQPGLSAGVERWKAWGFFLPGESPSILSSYPLMGEYMGIQKRSAVLDEGL